jgi:CHAT domain-containing protein/tetratricopeptide (TPR) repeat protein
MKAFALILVFLALFALAKAEKISLYPDSTKIKVLQQQLKRFSESGDTDSVLMCQQKLMNTYLELKHWKEAIKMQIDICASELEKSDFSSAEKSIENGFAMVHEHLAKDVYALAELYNLRSVLAYELGDYDKAIENVKQSIQYQLQINTEANKRDLATKYNNLAAIVSRKGDFDEAIYFYQKSLALRKKYGNELEVGESYNNLSVSYYRKKMFSEALNFQTKYLDILNKQSNEKLTREYILCYNSLGIYYLELKDYSKSLETLNKGLALNRIDEFLIEKTHHNLGYVYRMMNDDEKARHHLQKALALNQKKYKNGHPDIGKEYRHLGALEIKKENFEKGLYYFQLALINLVTDFSDSSFFSNPKLVNIRSKPDLLRSLRDKAAALRTIASKKTDNVQWLETSLVTSIVAIQLIELMRDEYESEAAREFIIEDALPVYAGALETIVLLQNAGRIDYVTQAFEVIEKSKALLLTESLQKKNRAVAFGVPDSLLQLEKKNNINIAFYEKQVADATTKNDSILATLHTNTLALYQEQQQLLKTNFKNNYPNYYANRNKFSVVTLQEMQMFLRKSETLLVEYFLSEDKLWIIAANDKHTRLIEKKLPSDFNLWVKSYLRSLKDYTLLADSSMKSYDLYKTSAYNLYAFLLKDLESEFTKNLLIVPHHELGYLPFEALLTNPAFSKFKGYTNLDYLIKKQSISYAYSATLHLAQSKSVNVTPVTCLAFAPGFDRLYTSTNDLLNVLPESKNEIELIKKVLNGQFYTEGNATKQKFRNEARNYGVIHLASHAVIDEQQPSNSKIYFSNPTSRVEDNVLHAYEIANLNLNADLVVLSACETGSGALARGEGVMSIGRSFMYAGTKSVLMNLWKSEDRSNASIISSFYTNIGDKKSKALSLKEAKLRYLNEADEFQAHPAFWAGYILVGHNGAMASQDNTFLVWLIVGFGITLFALLILSNRKAIV